MFQTSPSLLLQSKMSASDDLLSSDSGQESLVTRQSLSLSLKPPRVSPVGSAQHALLTGSRPNHRAKASHDQQDEAHSLYLHDTLRQRIQNQIVHSHETHSARLPHPHLPHGPDLADQITRFLGVVLPLSQQNAWRDSGGFRNLSDRLVALTAPSLAIASPRSASELVKLSRHVQTISYGHHPRQTIDIYRPHDDNEKKRDGQQNIVPPRTRKKQRLILFWHGGAWGSGYAWMYRLLATPFLERGYVVAIPDYRVYPDGCIQEQLDDICTVSWNLNQLFPRHRKTLMGHSSGAHVALLALVKGLQCAVGDTELSNQGPSLSFDSFVGLSGPYHIEHHFDYEAARGVEEISPMKPVNGYSRQVFRNNSPAPLLQSMLLSRTDERVLVSQMPKHILLVHGVEDATVPFTATGEAARVLRSCGVGSSRGGRIDEVYVAGAGHSDTVVQLMLGGRTRYAVLDWIRLVDQLNERDTVEDQTSVSFSATYKSKGLGPRLLISSKL